MTYIVLVGSRWSRPDASAVRSRVLSIIFKYVFFLRTKCICDPTLDREKMKIPANVVDQLIAGSQSDIRQVLNMLSTWKLSNTTMTFDEGKELCVASRFSQRSKLKLESQSQDERENRHPNAL